MGDDLPLADARNLGPVSAAWLAAVGVHTLDDIDRLGAARCFMMVKNDRNNVSLNLLWALEGAVLDMHWTILPDEVKQELLAEIEQK